MRIIGGKRRGTKILSAQYNACKPTLDSTRESIMNVLEHGRFKGYLRGARVADVFAGYGSMGLEMLSRGARHCDFFEKDRHVRSILKRNIQKITAHKDMGTCAIFNDALRRPPRQSIAYDIIFFDAPYKTTLNRRACQLFCGRNLITKNSIVILQMEKDSSATALHDFLHLKKIESRILPGANILYCRGAR